jgi:hypothetical protein
MIVIVKLTLYIYNQKTRFNFLLIGDCCLTPTKQFFSYFMVNIQWEDDDHDVRFVVDQHA